VTLVVTCNKTVEHLLVELCHRRQRGTHWREFNHSTATGAHGLQGIQRPRVRQQRILWRGCRPHQLRTAGHHERSNVRTYTAIAVTTALDYSQRASLRGNRRKQKGTGLKERCPSPLGVTSKSLHGCYDQFSNGRRREGRGEGVCHCDECVAGTVAA
jgi:hypothetical protein